MGHDTANGRTLKQSERKCPLYTRFLTQTPPSSYCPADKQPASLSPLFIASLQWQPHCSVPPRQTNCFSGRRD